MKDSIKNRKNKLLALCLSAMMLSSVAALAACTDGSKTDSSSSSSSSSASTSEAKDDGLIKNAGFETYNKDNAINTSATGWSRSVNSATSGSALSSKAASGIIDLSEEGWKNLTGSYYTNPDDVKALTEAQAKSVWDKLTVKDKLTYYEQWKKDNDGKKIAEKLDFYETINIDLGDIPSIDRFATHHKDGDEGYGEDSKVLMIHNEYPESDSTATYKALGTAQKYTSSSTVTVKAGTSAQFSVWVKTQDLQCSSTSGVPQDAVGKGAYISVTHSVGGKSLDAYMVENINTETMAESELSNGWKQYSFILKGSSYTDTTFSLVLGLGQGGGTYRGEYVNGYAFFDDIECKTISNEDFDDTLTDWGVSPAGFADKAEDKTVDVSEVTTVDKFALDFHGDFDAISDEVLTNIAPKATTSKVKGEDVSSLAGQNPAPALEGGLDGSKDVTKVFDSVADIASDANASGIAKYFENDDVAGKTLLLLSQKGVAYTADAALDFAFLPTANHIAPTNEETYLAISFMVKTSDMQGFTGATVTLTDKNTKTEFASIDTSDLDGVEVNDEDIHDGWQQYFFFVENASEDSATTFTLSFHFGPTTIDPEATKDSYHAGFAAFTNFAMYPMTQDEYESAQSGSYAKIVSVMGDKENDQTTASGFDSAKGTPSTALETGLANLQSYKGVYSDSAYITGQIPDGLTEEQKKYYTQENNLKATEGAAGLLSKEHFLSDEADAYYNKATGTAGYEWLDRIKAAAPSAADAQATWDAVFGDSSQPLFIWNKGIASGKSYGFVGKSTEIAANTYTAVSLRVKGSEGATASVYLVDTDGEKFDSTLSIGRNRTYWYDDDGNVCTADPTEKSTKIAFKLQPNGLYKVNKSCTAIYDALKAAGQENAYFANLQAYTEKDEVGNLLVAESGASHNYTKYWNNEGMDGIAYYYNKVTNGYCADKALKVPVLDLATVAGLTPRFETEAAKSLKAENIALSDEWTTVTFYIHTGDLAKNYRLEVWAGTREGVSTPADSYVVFDYNNPGTAESNFTGLLGDESYTEAATEQFDGVFSYFDTANYLRYNANLDEIGNGNLYEENYTPSANTDGIAYLLYKQGDEYTVFADYQYSEKAVTAAAVEEDTDDAEEEDKTEEPETNWMLLASSLAVAGVLIVAIASIVIRKIVAKSRKKRASQPAKKSKK